jgi:hypothetical protein
MLKTVTVAVKEQVVAMARYGETVLDYCNAYNFTQFISSIRISEAKIKTHVTKLAVLSMKHVLDLSFPAKGAPAPSKQ